MGLFPLLALAETVDDIFEGRARAFPFSAEMVGGKDKDRGVEITLGTRIDNGSKSGTYYIIFEMLQTKFVKNVLRCETDT